MFALWHPSLLKMKATKPVAMNAADPVPRTTLPSCILSPIGTCMGETENKAKRHAPWEAISVPEWISHRCKTKEASLLF